MADLADLLIERLQRREARLTRLLARTFSEALQADGSYDLSQARALRRYATDDQRLDALDQFEERLSHLQTVRHVAEVITRHEAGLGREE